MSTLISKIFYGLVFVVIFFVGIIMIKNFIFKEKKSFGTVIILNGPSASGKSSLQKAFIKGSDDFYLPVGIDSFFDKLLPDVSPDDIVEGQPIMQYTKKGEFIRGVEFLKDEKGNPTVPLSIGSAGLRVIYGMHQAIAAYAKEGNNLIVDYIMYDPAWLPHLQKALNGIPTCFVGITTPLEVIEEREKARATSPVGHTRSHYDQIHIGWKYNLTIDTSKVTPDEGAQQIIDYMKKK